MFNQVAFFVAIHITLYVPKAKLCSEAEQMTSGNSALCLYIVPQFWSIVEFEFTGHCGKVKNLNGFATPVLFDISGNAEGFIVMATSDRKDIPSATAQLHRS